MGTTVGCFARAASAPPPTPVHVGVDSIAGAVAVTGTASEQQIVLRTVGGVVRLQAATALDSTALVHLSGVEIVAHGTAVGAFFRVSDLTARRVDGQPVRDGVLRRVGSGLVLDTKTETLAIEKPPSVFWSMVGARIWIGGSLQTGPTTFGVIVPER